MLSRSHECNFKRGKKTAVAIVQPKLQITSTVSAFVAHIMSDIIDVRTLHYL